MGGFVRWVSKTVKQETSNTADTVVNTVVNPVVKTAQNLVRTVNTSVDNILRNPLPTIEVAVLIALDVPPPIASAAVSAANGGDLRQIALSAATSYAAQEIGAQTSNQYSPIENATLKQLGPQYADEALIKQIVASSSGTAAAVALRGGNFQQVLNAGVSGAVDSYIADTLKANGYNKVDTKILASATSAATKAILNGQDPAVAIGNSVAATTLSATISGKVDQINKNNEIGQGLYDSYTSLKQQATDYFNTKLAPAQTVEKQNYDNYVTARTAYTDLKTQFDAQYKIWSDNKDTNVDTANKAADSANALAPKLQTASDTLQKATDTFTTSSTTAQSLRDNYASTYTNPINDINTKITQINNTNTQFATDLGPLVTKYEQQAATDQSNIIKQIGSSAVEEAQKVSEQQAKDVGFKTYFDQQKAGDLPANEFYAQEAGFKSYADQKEAKNTSPLDFYAQKAGFKNGTEQQSALAVGIDNPQDWLKYKVAQETAQFNADRSATSYGFKDAADQKIASAAGFTDANQWSQYQSLSNEAKKNYDTQIKTGMSPDEALKASEALDALQPKDNVPEIVVTAPRDPYTGDIQLDLNGNPVKTPATTPTTPTTATTPATTTASALPLVTTPTKTTTTPAATTTPKLSPLSDIKLDTSPQYLGPPTGNVGQNLAHLGKLTQLYKSLEPDTQGTETADNSQTTDTSNLVDPMTYNPDLYKTKLMASGGSVTSNLTPVSNYDISLPYTTPNMLPPAPVVKQESRLGTLRNLFNSVGTQKIAHAAKGGLPTQYAQAAPKGHKPEFITGLTGYYAEGKGTGQSDDIPAMLHDGDYVADADLVAALGDGSSKAGAEALEKFRRQIPHKEHEITGEPVPAKIADGEYVFPASFVTAIGQGDNKAGAKLLDAMREEIRAHKRSAPTSKIPPKAKSPLDYLKMAKG